MNPYAHRKETYSVEDVLNSRLIADPLTLYQCCPTSEGGAAAVLCAADALDTYGIDQSRAIRVAAASLTSGNYNGRGSDHSAFSPYRTEPAALQAYEMAGIGPEDVDLAQVHDAATIGELQQIEALHLTPFGEAWQATVEGRTALGGDIPVNTDGGLLGHGPSLRGFGHPHGSRDGDAATGRSRAAPGGKRAGGSGAMLRRGRRYHGAYPDAVGAMVRQAHHERLGEWYERLGGCVMANYLIMAAMKGRFMSEQGNLYDNFQMLGYMEGASPFDAVAGVL